MPPHPVLSVTAPEGVITLNSHAHTYEHTLTSIPGHPPGRVCSVGGGVNHPCLWPLAALISGERWSRTRSISNAAGNDTSPAPPGPRPRRGCVDCHSPSITASCWILPPCFLAVRLKRKDRGENSASLFLCTVQERRKKTRRGREAAWWLLSGITSVLRHYHSKPLCLCLCPSHMDSRTHTHPKHVRMFPLTCKVDYLLCTGMC